MAAGWKLTAEKTAQFTETLQNMMVILDRMPDAPLVDDVLCTQHGENPHLVDVLTAVGRALLPPKFANGEEFHSELCKTTIGYLQTWSTMYRISALAVNILEKLKMDWPQRGVREVDYVKECSKNAMQTLHYIENRMTRIGNCLLAILDMADLETACKEITVTHYLVDVASVESKGCLNSILIVKDRLDCLYDDSRKTDNSIVKMVRMYASAITSYLSSAFGKTEKSSDPLLTTLQKNTSQTIQETLDYIDFQLDALDSHVEKLKLLFQAEE